MPLFGPVHGPPLPRVDHGSSLQAKVGLYRALFAGRRDVYAYRWENTAEGTKGWAPRRRPGTTRDNPEYLPLTDEVISAHLTKEDPAACGLYVMLPDSTCRLLVCDFDGGTWRLDAAAYAEAAAWAGVPAAVELSRSGDGAHVWTFFSEPVAAADARAMGAALLHEAMAIRGEMDIELRPPLPCAGLSAAARLRELDRAAAGGQVPPESHDVVRRSGDVRALPGSVRVLVIA
jgi:hypothetical protein